MILGPSLVSLLTIALPSFHLVLSDGNDQLKGQAERVADTISKSFRTIGIEVGLSSDPSNPSLCGSRVVNVIVLPRSSEDWQLSPGILAATRRDFRRLVLERLRQLCATDDEFRAEAEAILGVKAS